MEGTKRTWEFNQQSRDHTVSQSLKRQAQDLHGSALDPLHICYEC